MASLGIDPHALSLCISSSRKVEDFAGFPVVKTESSKRKGGNKSADGRKRTNFATNCQTPAKRRSYVRSKVGKTLSRNLLTFHHNAGGTHGAFLLLEDGRVMLSGDSALGKRLWEDPIVLERLLKLFPTKESIENRRTETPEERRDYARVIEAIRETSKFDIVEVEPKTIYLDGNDGSAVAEAYLDVVLDRPPPIDSSPAPVRVKREPPPPPLECPAPVRIVALDHTLDMWTSARRSRMQSKFGVVGDGVLFDVYCRSIPLVWRPQQGDEARTHSAPLPQQDDDHLLSTMLDDALSRL